MSSFYYRGTNTTIGTIKGVTGKQIKLRCLVLTATALLTVTIASASTPAVVIDVDAGVNEFKHPLVFAEGEDVTIAVNSGGTASVFGEAVTN